MCLITDSNLNTISIDEGFRISNIALDANLEQKR